MPFKKAAAATDSGPLRVFIAYRRGPLEGDPCALWLERALRQAWRSPEGSDLTIEPYLDRYAPGIPDWREKWLGDLKTCRAFVLICSPGARTRRQADQDWLHEEIDWWVSHRKTAPILVDATGDGVSNIPEVIHAKWPDAQRVVWKPSPDSYEQERLRDSVLEGILLSERGVRYEEIQRLRWRNRLLVTALVLALILGVWLARELHVAEENRRHAVARQLSSAAVASGQMGLVERAAWLAAQSIERDPGAEADAVLRDSLAKLPHRLLKGQTEELTWAAPSPSGDLLLAIGYDDSVRVRRIADGKEVLRFQEKNPLRGAWSPDGKRFAIVGGETRKSFRGNRILSSEGFAVLWDLEQKHELARLEFEDPATKVYFHPSGKKLTVDSTVYSISAAGALKEESRVWMTVDGKFQASFPQGSRLVAPKSAMSFVSEDTEELAVDEGLSVRPGGDRMKAEDYEREKGTQVTITSLRSGKETGRRRFRGSGLVRLSPDRRYLCHSESGLLEVWDRQADQTSIRDEFDGYLLSEAFSADGSLFGAVFPDGRVRIWRSADGNLLADWGGAPGTNRALEIGKAGLVVLLRAGGVDALELKPGHLYAESPGWADNHLGLALDPGGRYLAFQSVEKNHDSLTLYEIKTGQATTLPPGHDLLDFSPDSTLIATQKDQHPMLLRMPDGKPLRQLAADNVLAGAFLGTKLLLTMGSFYPQDRFTWFDTATGGQVRQVTLPETAVMNPDASLIAVYDVSKMEVRTVPEGTVRWSRPLQRSPDDSGLTNVIFSPDSSVLTAGSRDNFWIWNAQTGKLIARRKFDRAHPQFSADSRYFLLRAETSVTVFEARSARPISTLAHTKGKVLATAFSPDSNYIATGGDDHNALLWKIGTSAPIARIAHAQGVNGLVFDPRGRYLMTLTAGPFQYVQFHLWHIDDLRRSLCERLTANLSRVEWDALATSEAYSKVCPDLP